MMEKGGLAKHIHKTQSKILNYDASHESKDTEKHIVDLSFLS